MRDCHVPYPHDCDAVLIAGPTASGKSALALCWAVAMGGAVINTDSMQVYRDLRILSARPSIEDEGLAPHLLYGHVSAQESYSLGRFREDAAAALAEAKGRGLVPIFTGGTGMYFAALTEGLAAIPPISEDVRTAAREKLTAIGVAALHAELAAMDPMTAAALRPSDPQRVLRAYEVFVGTGRPLADWQKESLPPVLAGLRLAKVVVDPPREVLRERIATRFHQMMDMGAAAEAETLRGIDPALPAAKVLGLRELWAIADGRLRREEGVDLAITATRQFAKRQVTWTRNRMADWQRISLTS